MIASLSWFSDSYGKDQSPEARHPFAVWLVVRHGRDIGRTPLGAFTHAFAEAFPPTGDRAALRATVVGVDYEDDWMGYVLQCFDVAWEQYAEHVLGDLL